MFSSDRILGIFFLSQTMVGVLGNSAMFTMYVHIFVAEPQQKKPTDLILTHLTVTNTMTLLTQGVPEVMVAFGMKNIMDDGGCKVLCYIRRVARGLSICFTCLLSVFQAVTISPRSSWWSQFKPRASRYILPSFFIFWISNLMIYTSLIESAQATNNITMTEHMYISKYCSTVPKSSEFTVLTLFTTTFGDVLLVFLMSWASGHMVMVLHRHHRQVQHIRSSGRSPKSSTETRAIHTILLLVSCFVCFYWLNSFINIYLSFVKGYEGEAQGTTAFLSSCFPSISPLVLITRDPRFPRPHCLIKKVKFPSPSGISSDVDITTQICSVSSVLWEDSSPLE
ncbi:vomeronasal type-1 receptor 4-like [Tachyglossus aculeatus]|uniref:vomeronasal type-1 receptor 4-like n=1 Tax=Tachyglossus aculeatus TaxID=9261 RepID=UPI0018F63495|nr:vomeronasal type-1 receptor 4-like [Tachyglossus aculeatus]